MPSHSRKAGSIARLFSSHPESPRVESAAMRTKIYPWIILCAILAIGILYAPRPEKALAKLKWELYQLRYGRSSKCAF
jgi:hypothetical protein